jgi:hypothetical protein
MRRALIALVAIAGLSIPVVASAAGKRHIKFTDKIVGNSIGGTQAAFKVHDTHFGNGAGVQTVKLSGLNGTDSEVTYYGNASLKSKGSFTVGAPDASGIATITGSGHDVSGTGKAKGVSSSYTYAGTLNTKTGVFTVTLKGTYTL